MPTLAEAADVPVIAQHFCQHDVIDTLKPGRFVSSLATQLAAASVSAEAVAAALAEEGRSGGKFLYAVFVLNDIASGDLPLRQPSDLEALPAGMDGFYQQTFHRRFPTDAFYGEVRDRLAVQAVQRDPLSQIELATILGRPQAEIVQQQRQLHDLLRLSKADPAYGPHEVLAGFDHPSLSRWLSATDSDGYDVAGRFAIDRPQAEAAITRWALAEEAAQRAHTWPYLVRHLASQLPAEHRPAVLPDLLGRFAWLEARLRLGWLLTTPEALALMPACDRQRIAALDASGRPFEPDRLGVALAPRVAALQALGVPRLLKRFTAGETIAANDPAVLELHALAAAHRGQLLTALGVSPRKLPRGTLRALLEASGWRLEKAGRIKARGDERDTYTYKARREALPEGVSAEALAAAFLAELRQPLTGCTSGAKNASMEILRRGEKSPRHPPVPPLRPLPLAAAATIPWISGPPRPPSVSAWDLVAAA